MPKAIAGKSRLHAAIARAARGARMVPGQLGTEQGTVARVARQLGYGVESVRSWVRQADIDEGLAPVDSESRRSASLAEIRGTPNGHSETSI